MDIDLEFLFNPTDRETCACEVVRVWGNLIWYSQFTVAEVLSVIPQENIYYF